MRNRNYKNSAKPASFAANERVYNVFTHGETPPLRIRATSRAQSLEIGLALAATRSTPQFRSLITEIPANGDCAGQYYYRDCQALTSPHAVRSNDQQSRTDN